MFFFPGQVAKEEPKLEFLFVKLRKSCLVVIFFTKTYPSLPPSFLQKAIAYQFFIYFFATRGMKKKHLKFSNVPLWKKKKHLVCLFLTGIYSNFSRKRCCGPKSTGNSCK